MCPNVTDFEHIRRVLKFSKLHLGIHCSLTPNHFSRETVCSTLILKSSSDYFRLEHFGQTQNTYVTRRMCSEKFAEWAQQQARNILYYTNLHWM